jgi:hypothetical protein
MVQRIQLFANRVDFGVCGEPSSGVSLALFISMENQISLRTRYRIAPPYLIDFMIDNTIDQVVRQTNGSTFHRQAQNRLSFTGGPIACANGLLLSVAQGDIATLPSSILET